MESYVYSHGFIVNRQWVAMIVDEGAENHIAPYESRASNFDKGLKEQDDNHEFLCSVSGKL